MNKHIARAPFSTIKLMNIPVRPITKQINIFFQSSEAPPIIALAT